MALVNLKMEESFLCKCVNESQCQPVVHEHPTAQSLWTTELDNKVLLQLWVIFFKENNNNKIVVSNLDNTQLFSQFYCNLTSKIFAHSHQLCRKDAFSLKLLQQTFGIPGNILDQLSGVY